MGKLKHEDEEKLCFAWQALKEDGAIDMSLEGAFDEDYKCTYFAAPFHVGAFAISPSGQVVQLQPKLFARAALQAFVRPGSQVRAVAFSASKDHSGTSGGSGKAKGQSGSIAQMETGFRQPGSIA